MSTSNADDQRRKQDEAEKARIVESKIELRIEGIGGVLSPDRKDGLRTMTLPKLRELAEILQRLDTASDAITAVVKAISDSQRARRMAEDEELDNGSGPAEVEMSL